MTVSKLWAPFTSVFLIYNIGEFLCHSLVKIKWLNNCTAPNTLPAKTKSSKMWALGLFILKWFTLIVLRWPFCLFVCLCLEIITVHPRRSQKGQANMKHWLEGHEAKQDSGISIINWVLWSETVTSGELRAFSKLLLISNVLSNPS